MKRFTWRLQRVLDIKTKQEQIKRMELLDITEKLSKARAMLFIRQTTLKEAIADVAAGNPQNKLLEQELLLKSAPVNNRLIKKLKDKVQQLELKQKEKITEVLKIRRFNEGLKKLRARKKREFIESEEKLEQKQLDEGASIRFARKIIGK